jgi:hypothetical protein
VIADQVSERCSVCRSSRRGRGRANRRVLQLIDAFPALAGACAPVSSSDGAGPWCRRHIELMLPDVGRGAVKWWLDADAALSRGIAAVTSGWRIRRCQAEQSQSAQGVVDGARQGPSQRTNT